MPYIVDTMYGLLPYKFGLVYGYLPYMLDRMYGLLPYKRGSVCRLPPKMNRCRRSLHVKRRPSVWGQEGRRPKSPRPIGTLPPSVPHPPQHPLCRQSIPRSAHAGIRTGRSVPATSDGLALRADPGVRRRQGLLGRSEVFGSTAEDVLCAMPRHESGIRFFRSNLSDADMATRTPSP